MSSNAACGVCASVDTASADVITSARAAACFIGSFYTRRVTSRRRAFAAKTLRRLPQSEVSHSDADHPRQGNRLSRPIKSLHRTDVTYLPHTLRLRAIHSTAMTFAAVAARSGSASGCAAGDLTAFVCTACFDDFLSRMTSIAGTLGGADLRDKQLGNYQGICRFVILRPTS
jgi:hypothetical protein